MNTFLTKVWLGWKKVGLIMGDIVSGIVLTVFYFTFFALFAVPFKIFSKSQKSKSSFKEKELKPDALEYFQKEF